MKTNPIDLMDSGARAGMTVHEAIDYTKNVMDTYGASEQAATIPTRAEEPSAQVRKQAVRDVAGAAQNAMILAAGGF